MKAFLQKWIGPILVGSGALVLLVTFLLPALGVNVFSGSAAANSGNPMFVDLSKVPSTFCPNLVQKDLGGASQIETVSGGTKIPKFDAGVTHPVVGSSSASGTHIVLASLDGKKVAAKLWADATNTQLKPQTLSAEEAVVCRDPAQAAMVMNGLGRVKIEGVTIAQTNKAWMVAQGNAKTAVSSWAQKCLVDNDSTRIACSKVMAATAYLLTRFVSVSGVHHTKVAWYYSAPGPKVGGVPAFQLNKSSYTGYFVEFKYTEKSGKSCDTFGFNVGKATANGGDQRLVGLACKPPSKPCKATTTHSCGSSKPPCGSKCTTLPCSGSKCHTTPPCSGSGCTLTCTSGPSKGNTPPASGICPSGKFASEAPPPPSGKPVVQCPPGEYVPRGGTSCVKETAPSTSPSPKPDPAPTHTGGGPTLPPPTEPPAPPPTTDPVPTPIPTPPPPPAG